ncbi:MAG: DNA repair protein RecN [Bacillota bacterium]|nr:DNA repair protein RecN [Bacillota bacterium]
MLLELQIKDFALVEEVELKFEEGFNVLSGETGAGKSIIIGAVTVLLGGRASSEHIRTGADEAVIHGVFAVPEGSAARRAIEDLGIDVGDDDLVVISRTISRAGRNQCRVNGRPVTQGMLSGIGEHLVDIHGQHEHQSLLRVGRHIEFLDEFAGAEALKLREQVRSHHDRLLELEGRLAALRSGERERAQRLDLLEFQAREIDAVRLSPGEDVQLARDRAVLAAADQLYAHARAAYAALRGSEAGVMGAFDAIAAAISEIEAILKVDDSVKGVAELLQSALAACEEAARALRVYRDGIEVDPARLAQIEERLSALQRLKRKYGDTVDEILEYRRRIGEELEKAASSEEEIARIEDELARVRASLGALSASLHEVRVRAARALEEQVEAELADLNMGSSEFCVSFSAKEDPQGVPVGGRLLAVGPNGTDAVEFLLSANPGEPAKPLARIASGGEISRVMLALKSILASVDEVGTLIFDEIDAGIGGRTATAVGEKLAATSRMRQVVCVTHLAQIASMADVHYGISKVEKDGRTRTVVERLEGEARIAEIARMLGGAELTPTTFKHAREMLQAALHLKDDAAGRCVDRRAFAT